MENKIQDYVSGAWVQAHAEEVEAVQPMLKYLVEQLGYSKNQIQAHPQVRVKRRPSDKQGYPMDIVVYTDETKKVIKMIIFFLSKLLFRSNELIKRRQNIKI